MMIELQTFKCRISEIEDDFHEVKALFPDDAAENYVEKYEGESCEYASDKGVEVEVEGHGKYRVTSYMTRIYTSSKVE